MNNLEEKIAKPEEEYNQDDDVLFVHDSFDKELAKEDPEERIYMQGMALGLSVAAVSLSIVAFVIVVAGLILK